jgi:hypothetical protein
VETLKDGFTTFAAIVGTLTGLLTLYAKYLDVKKAADAAMTAAVSREPMPGFDRPDDLVDLVPRDFPKARDFSALTRARAAVKAPAIALMVAGAISLFFNLFVSAFGYVDHYVTPLTTESQARKDFIEDGRRGEFQVAGRMAGPGSAYRDSEESNVVLTIFTLMSLAAASAAAIWAGFGMIRLRSYWLSVAGSFAIMVGAGFCCMSGIPIGVWSLVILFRPEVSSAFD